MNYESNYQKTLERLQAALPALESEPDLAEIEDHREEVLNRYGKLFSSENVEHITKLEFIDFLSFRNNWHWEFLHRQQSVITKDMEKLRTNLKISFDPSLSLPERYNKTDEIRGIGKNTLSAILLVHSPKEFGVWTDHVDEFLDIRGIHPGYGPTDGDTYEKVNKTLLRLSEDLGKELWTVDTLIYHCCKVDLWSEEDSSSHERVYSILPEIGPDTQIWIETVSRKPENDNSNWALGSSLWSPIESKDGRDIYPTMRKAKVGDVIIHIACPSNLTRTRSSDWKMQGFSKVATTCTTSEDAPQDTGGHPPPFQKIDLKGYEKFEPELFLGDFISNYKALLKHAKGDVKNFPFAFRKDGGVGLSQGAYLSTCTPRLYKMLDSFLAGEDQVGKIWCIYVGKKAARNFSLGIDKGTWGFSKQNPVMEGLGAGDRVLFLQGLTSDQSPPPIGYPRVSSLDLDNIRGFAKHAIEVEVTKGLYESDEEIWPDQPYPFRFDFQKTGTAVGMAISSDHIEKDLLENIRMAANSNGNPHPLPDDGRILIPEEKPQPKYTLDDLIRETSFKKEDAEAWWALLLRKKQVILQGPPGTGKTFVAEKLAKLLISETRGTQDLVQFHPSYSYEDFMQGFYPNAKDNTFEFKLEDGRFKKACDQARASEEPTVFIIDEINRADLSRVFGELMYLLEYRDKEVQLARSGDSFSIPENLYIVGTMNTADRSIAVVDHALRRRFSFIRLAPEYDVLRKELGDTGFPVGRLIIKLEEINKEIDNRDYEIGISFFLKDNLSDTIRLIWLYEIEPYLEEYFFKDPEVVDPFRWNKVKNMLSPQTESHADPTD